MSDARETLEALRAISAAAGEAAQKLRALSEAAGILEHVAKVTAEVADGVWVQLYGADTTSESPPAVDAVDPQVTSTGKPTTRDNSLTSNDLPPTVTEERDRLKEEPERLARQMFSAGVDVARSYGDNAFHLWGEQLERQFQNAMARVKEGK